jgi:gliding motility-associated-like protein
VVPQPIVSDNCEIRTLINTYTHTDNASAVYPVGTTEVWWSVVDMSGNISNCSMNITVTDTEAPLLLSPENISIGADPGLCGAYLTIPEPAATDNCGIQSIVNSFNGTDLLSGFFPVGTTTINWTVTDIHGLTSQCSMDVTVLDNEVPTIIFPDDITTDSDPGVCEASITIPQPEVYDNCGIASIINSYNGTSDASGIFPTGSTTISWTVTDVHGNQAQFNIIVNVNDNEPPTITCPAIIEANTDQGAAYATIDIPLPVVNDNCGISSLWNSYNGTDDASDAYPIGTTIVTWSITDIHGLITKFEMAVIVYDIELPSIICPGDILINAGADCNAYVEIEEPFVADNTGVETLLNNYNNTANASGVYPAGTTEIRWTVTDKYNNVSTCNMNITVVSRPVAEDDFITTEMNIPAIIPVLANDTDCDNNIDTGTISITENPENGFAMVDHQNGTIIYTSNAAFYGTDTFFYKVCDQSGLCDEAMVTIVVNGDEVVQPVYLIAVNDLDSTFANTPLLLSNHLNDIVPAGITSGIRILNQPSNGTLELHDDLTITYNPFTDFTGTDEFTYELYDVNSVAISDTATATIVVMPVIKSSAVVIYNVITPNNDGQNDTWVIDGIEEFTDNEVLLFNRWGDQIGYFRSYNNHSVVWAGRSKDGKELPNGTYYYIIKLKATHETLTGWVIIHGI